VRHKSNANTPAILCKSQQPPRNGNRFNCLSPKASREKSGADADFGDGMETGALNSKRKHAGTNEIEPAATAQRQSL